MCPICLLHLVISNRICVSSFRTTSFHRHYFTSLPSTHLIRKGDKTYMMTFDRLPSKGVTAWPCGVRKVVKNQSMYIRCQCAVLYHSNKVDSTGSIVDRLDYQNATFCNDRKNNHHGRKGTNGSHWAAIDRCISEEVDWYSFSLALFLDAYGYFLKSCNGSVLHQFPVVWRKHVLMLLASSKWLPRYDDDKTTIEKRDCIRKILGK
jgi:hypothetical protein